jgi:NTP pyrophosphatase (non-canonical NTP hydrolase)
LSLSIRDTQAEILAWSTRNFGRPVPIAYDVSSFLGMVEEVGEIAHAVLKMSQNIKGTRAKHEADVIDGIADLIVFTLDFAGRNGLDAESALERVWAKVKQRDFTKDKDLGGLMGHCRACSQATLIDPVTEICAWCHAREKEIETAQSLARSSYSPNCPCWATGPFIWVQGCPDHPRESMT